MTSEDEAGAHDNPSISSKLVLLAAGLTGFVFLSMELVWYRMLAPLLGGSSYSFGMILAVALLGIGVGGLLYGAWAKRVGAHTHGIRVYRCRRGPVPGASAGPGR